MKSTTTNRFAQVAKANIQRSSFNRSHSHKTTFNSGKLIPIYVDEALPGDTFKMRANVFARMSTPIYPIMDNLFMDIFWFDCPIRLVWDNFKKFMGEQANPGDSTDYIVPTMTLGGSGWTEGLSGDYLGLPTGVAGLTHSSLPFRAINLIWNEWFRDQNLQDSVVVDRGDGPDTVSNYSALLSRGKRHDYFTSCLPWPQKGDAVTMPLGDTAPVFGDGNPTIINDGSTASSMYVRTNDLGTIGNLSAGATTYFDNLTPDGSTGLQVDLSSATSATISLMRQSVAIQQMLERDARGGTRYKELIKSHFNVDSPDARLMRPELLGISSVPVNISPIAQTSATDATVSPQGNLAAMGTVSVRNKGFTKSFTEHSIVLGFCSIRADLSYQQGMNRMWSRSTKYDFFWPGLENLSEQAVLNKEIYAQGTSVDDDVFGYQERYSEYKYKPSIITGKMRSSASGTLDAWHLAQDFTSLPVLDSTFIQDTPPVDRVVAVPSEPEFIFDSYYDLKCVRPMQVFTTPGLARF